MSRHLLPLLVLGCSACAGPSTSGEDTGGTEQAEAATIYGVRTGDVDLGSLTLEGVVATSGLTRDAAGFYIQDLGGGEETGLYVFVQRGAQDLDLSAGDILRLQGRVAEYYGRLEFTLEDDEDLEVIGSADPVGHELSTSATAEELAPWTENLVTLVDPAIASCPDLVGHMDLDGEMEWGDAFVSVLAGPEDSISSLKGILDSDLARYALHPRAADDIEGETAGAGCSTTVAAINTSSAEGGVMLEQVVSTSGLGRQGEGFFVQDPGGGDNSGIFVSFGWLDPGHGLAPEVGEVLALRGVAMTEGDRRQVALTSADALWSYAEAEPEVTRLSEAPADWSVYVGSLVRFEQITTTGPTTGGETETSYGVDIGAMLASLDLEAGLTYEGITGVLHTTGGELQLMPRDEDDIGEAGASSAVDASIAQVVSGELDPGLTVRLEEVVAISPVALDGSGFVVQDATGGEGTGIQVTLTMDPSEAPEIFVGDLLNMEALVSAGGGSGRPQLMLSSELDLTMVGSTDFLAEAFTETPDDWDPWVDTLVSLHDLTIGSTDSGSVSTSWGVPLDSRYLTLTTAEGDSFSEVIGVLHYDDEGTVRLAPRNSYDLRSE